MPPVAPNTNDIFELKLKGDLFGQTMMNVFHYRLYQAGTWPDLFQAYDAFLTAWQAGTMKTSFLSCCPSDYELRQITFQKVELTREVYRAVAQTAPGTGAAANAAQCANAVVTKQTALVTHRGPGPTIQKGGTGTVHFPGIPNGAAVAGVITAAYETRMVTFIADMIAVVNDGMAGQWNPCLWHRYAGSQPQSDDLIAGIAQPTIRTMKRRVVGRGI